MDEEKRRDELGLQTVINGSRICSTTKWNANPLFKGTARKQDRSKMNPTFVLNDESHTEAFNKLWNDANISGIKGPPFGWRLQSIDVQCNGCRQCAGVG